MSSIYDTIPASKGAGSIYDTPTQTVAKPVSQQTTSIYNRLASPTGLGTVAAPFVSAYKGVTEGFQNTPTAPKSGDVLGETVKAVSNAIKQGSSNLDTHLQSIQDNGLFSLKGGTAAGETVLNSINTVFGVALSPLQGLASIPGVGGVVDGVNKIFGAIAEGGGQAATQVLNELPIPQDAKDTLHPLVHDAAGFVSQILAGKAGGDALGVLGDKVKAITNTVDSQLKGAQAAVETGPVRNVPVQGESVETKVPIQSQYTPPDQLPTIQMGPKVAETLPTAETSPAGSPDVQINPQVDTAPVQKLSPVSGEVAKASSDISTTLVKQGFDALPPEEQAKFTPQSYTEQANYIGNLLDTTPDEVKAMATSGKGIPTKVNGQILFNAVEALATKEGDGDLLRQLAGSPLAKKLSEAAQTMGGHGFNDNPNSPVDAIREVQAARQASVKNIDIPTETSKVVDNLVSDTKTARAPSTSWADFAKQIVCNI